MTSKLSDVALAVLAVVTVVLVGLVIARQGDEAARGPATDLVGERSRPEGAPATGSPSPSGSATPSPSPSASPSATLPPPTAGPGGWLLGTDGRVTHEGGEAGPPCTPLAVSGVDRRVARLLCDDGRLFGTADAGERWSTLGSLRGATTIAFANAAEGYAVAPGPGCGGTAVHRTTNGGSRWVPVHCTTLSGPWRLAVSDDEVTLANAVGARVTSTDRGETWQ